MVDQLNGFASEVTRVAREVGTEGKLGGQAQVPGVAGTRADFAMPGKNGVETIRYAQQKYPGLRAVLMTGYADDPSVATLRESIPILRKPIVMAELVRALA